MLGTRDILVQIRIQLRKRLLSSVTLRMQKKFFFFIFFLITYSQAHYLGSGSGSWRSRSPIPVPVLDPRFSELALCLWVVFCAVVEEGSSVRGLWQNLFVQFRSTLFCTQWFDVFWTRLLVQWLKRGAAWLNSFEVGTLGWMIQLKFLFPSFVLF